MLLGPSLDGIQAGVVQYIFGTMHMVGSGVRGFDFDQRRHPQFKGVHLVGFCYTFKPHPRVC